MQNSFKHTRTEQEIVYRWKNNKEDTLIKLADVFGKNVQQIRTILQKHIDPEEYRRIVKGKVGGGSAKRKANPTYPKWMQE